MSPNVKRKLESKSYRDALVQEFISHGLAFQLRETRELRGWSQSELGERASMKQELISRYENPDYGKYTLKTLLKLAFALDVALAVRFVPFSELATWGENLKVGSLAVPSFETDPGFAKSVMSDSTSDDSWLTTSVMNATAGPAGVLGSVVVSTINVPLETSDIDVTFYSTSSYASPIGTELQKSA